MNYVSPYSSILWVTATISITVCVQQRGVEAKARATEEDRVNATTCMPGAYDKKIFIDDEKAMLIPTQVARDIPGGKQQIKRLYARNLMMLLASK